LLYYDANLGSPATPPPRPGGGGGWQARVVFVRRHEDLFTARRAGTARKGGRASTGGLKVRSVWAVLPELCKPSRPALSLTLLVGIEGPRPS
jgi:hypothetical protein